MRGSRITAIVTAAAILIGGYAVVQGGGEDPGTANFWVDTNGGTCVRQSPAGVYNDATACSSLNAAYQASGTACGDFVSIKAGTYANQAIVERSALTGCNPDVTFRAAFGETVNIPQILFGDVATPASNAPDDITVTGPITMLRGIGCTGDCHDIVIDDIDGGTLSLYGYDGFGNTNNPKRWTIQNSDWGPCESDGGPQDLPANTCNVQVFDTGQIELIETEDMSFINNNIHDYDTSTLGSEPAGHDHYECVGTDGPEGNLFRGNKFWGCEIEALGTANWRGSSIIENNFFGGSDYHDATDRGQAIGLDGDIGGTVLIRNNSFSMVDAVGSSDTGDYSDYTITGNIIGSGDLFGGDLQCLSGATYKYNVIADNTTCGDATNTMNAVFSNFYVNTNRNSSMDYHLTGSNDTPDNFVPTSVTGGCPSTDIDGEARPANSNCDAGADERNQ